MNHSLALAVPYVDLVVPAVAQVHAMARAVVHHAPQIVDPSAPVVWSEKWGAGRG